MLDFTDAVVGSAICLVLALLVTFGWIWAHNEIATECQRQGSFYVGDKDFVCQEVKRELGK